MIKLCCAVNTFAICTICNAMFCDECWFCDRTHDSGYASPGDESEERRWYCADKKVAWRRGEIEAPYHLVRAK